jgi:hypothetical protein
MLNFAENPGDHHSLILDGRLNTITPWYLQVQDLQAGKPMVGHNTSQFSAEI